MGIIFQKVLQHHIIVPSKNLNTSIRFLGESQHKIGFKLYSLVYYNEEELFY